MDKLIKELESLINNKLKQRIIDLDLVDTGLMRDSTLAKVSLTPDGVEVDIKSTDYFKYLDGDYHISIVLTEPVVGDLIGEIMFKRLEDELDW